MVRGLSRTPTHGWGSDDGRKRQRLEIGSDPQRSRTGVIERNRQRKLNLRPYLSNVSIVDCLIGNPSVKQCWRGAARGASTPVDNTLFFSPEHQHLLSIPWSQRQGVVHAGLARPGVLAC